LPFCARLNAIFWPIPRLPPVINAIFEELIFVLFLFKNSTKFRQMGKAHNSRINPFYV
jgi:hypothetical protein